MSHFSFLMCIKGEGAKKQIEISQKSLVKEVDMMTDSRLHQVVQQYGDTVYKIALVILKNSEDAKDALQETFLRYYRRAPEFESAEHEKAWIIRCATNISKNMLRTIFRHSHEPLDENVAAAPPAKGSLSELFFHLPLKDRMILQLRYIEGYSAEEIGKMLRIPSSTVRKRLERARGRAKAIYEKEFV